MLAQPAVPAKPPGPLRIAPPAPAMTAPPIGAILLAEVRMPRLADLLSSDGLLYAACGAALAGLAALLLAAAVPPREAAEPDAPPQAPAFTLELAADGRSAALEGRIDFGATEALAGLLETAGELRLLRLGGPGGRIAEARGLVRLVERHGLDTAALGDCASACALVFVSGRRRSLEPGARLGFHRYGQRSPLVGLFLDAEAEQERDNALFRRRGVAEAFLARVDATPHDSLWFPTRAELLAAGVVNAPRPEQRR